MNTTNLYSAFDSETSNEISGQFVTIFIGSQLFGIPILQVRDVFFPEQITPVPLARKEIAGLLNLRGHIVTAIDIRPFLGLPLRNKNMRMIAVGVEHDGEYYGLLIDSVGEVLHLGDESYEPPPTNLDQRWLEVSSGIHILKDQLMVILKVDRLFNVMTNCFTTTSDSKKTDV